MQHLYHAKAYYLNKDRASLKIKTISEQILADFSPVLNFKPLIQSLDKLRYQKTLQKGDNMKSLLVIMALFVGALAQAGDSGCGLGSLIISKNSKGLQLLSLTTNGSFFSQGFGITSGTSGCSSSGIVKNEMEMQYFVEVNSEELSREMARGEGEKLSTLAQMHGCKDKTSQNLFANMTKDSFDFIFLSPESTPSEILSNIKSEMSNHSEVNKACQLALAQ